MRKIAKISAVLVAAIASLSFSAAAASAATAEPAAPAATCTVVGSGSPGYLTFTVHIDSDGCGLPAAAAAECVLSIYQGPYSDPYVYTTWVYGPTVHSGGTTSKTASCGLFNVYFLTYGFNVYYSGAWHYTQIGTE
jgi:hypothetical protein